MLSGYCDLTGWEYDGGNCDTGTKGFWNLKAAHVEDWDKAFVCKIPITYFVE